MGKWFVDFQALVWAATIALGALAWTYSSFATKEALNEKDQSLRSYVDQKHNSVLHILERVESTLQRVDERTYELNRKSRRD